MVNLERWGPAAPSTPRLALSLRILAHDVEARYPARHREADGWIGDASHAARRSDHNPDSAGIVHAVDLTSAGMRPIAIVTAAVLHPSTAYVIWDGLIWSKSTGFNPRRYSGDNPHRDHVHVSILHTTRAERNSRHWLVGTT